MNNILLSNGALYDKLQTHQRGLQHYAFSIFLFNSSKELLLQKRALNKYHSGGLWSNTCCSHFKSLKEFNNKEIAIKQRLKDEIGINFAGELKFTTIFKYKATVGSLIENEIDYIYIGNCDYDVNRVKHSLNRDEVADLKYMSLLDLKQDIKLEPQNYTVWLKKILINANLDHLLLF